MTTKSLFSSLRKIIMQQLYRKPPKTMKLNQIHLKSSLLPAIMHTQISLLGGKMNGNSMIQ